MIISFDKIEWIKYVIDRPHMFRINNIEEFQIYLNGYIAGSKDGDLESFFNDFSDYIRNDFDFALGENYTAYNWCKILRFFSSTDVHSLELLVLKFEDFLKTR